MASRLIATVAVGAAVGVGAFAGLHLMGFGAAGVVAGEHTA